LSCSVNEKSGFFEALAPGLELVLCANGSDLHLGPNGSATLGTDGSSFGEPALSAKAPDSTTAAPATTNNGKDSVAIATMATPDAMAAAELAPAVSLLKLGA
jgi:hypothetical protein